MTFVPPAEVGNRRASFRLEAQTVFLTYPRCPRTKEEALAVLEETFPLDWAVVASESHQDGTPHLHVLARLRSKSRKSGYEIWDRIGGQHGNYQAARNVSAVLRYVKKDGNFIVSGTPPADDSTETTGKVAKGTAIAMMILEGATLQDLNEADPGFVMMNLTRVRTYMNFVKTTNTPMVPLRITVQTDHPETMMIFRWFDENLAPGQSLVRPIKTPQLWMWGPANTRKTSAVLLFHKWCSIYNVPHHDTGFNDFYSDSYDLAFLDEFSRGCVQEDWLKQFSQGSPMPIKIKGSSMLKERNMPMVICSNQAPSSYIPDLEEYKAIEARFLIVYVSTPLDLDGVTIEPLSAVGPDDPQVPSSVLHHSTPELWQDEEELGSDATTDY